MRTYFETLTEGLYEQAHNMLSMFIKAKRLDNKARLKIPNEFTADFFRLVDKVNVSLMEDKDNFYGYFLLQMTREIRFDISSPTAVNFKGAHYVIYFNPIIFLTLTLKQMESTIKHEILHIVAMHILRAKECKAGYSTAAINMAMDIVVNTYLDNLPPYAVTLEWVNLNYSLELLPFEPFEYYLENIQTALNLLDVANEGLEADSRPDEAAASDYNPEKTHDIWEETSDIAEKTLQEFTEKVIIASQKGSIPTYLESMIASLKNSKGELSWNVYLKRLMGTVAGNIKKTITRRNRRQPARLDLRGQLRSHKAKLVVALDISGSISDEEFNQAMQEVFAIVKNYNHEITVVECDSEIRRVYKVQAVKDIKARMNIRGGTKFTPVFEYANNNKVNLLVYFTDGKGEDALLTKPKGYKTLWVISGKGETLSVKEAYGAVARLNPVEIKEKTLDMSDVIFRDGYSMNDQEKIHI